MALPDLNLYYIAAQLSQLFHIGKTDRDRFFTFLCPRWSHSTGDPLKAITGPVRAMHLAKEKASLLHYYRRIWAIAIAKFVTTLTRTYTIMAQSVSPGIMLHA